MSNAIENEIKCLCNAWGYMTSNSSIGTANNIISI